MTKVAIVTAAGRGIGAGIARKLAADGYKLGLLSPGEGVVKLAASDEGVDVGNQLRLSGCLIQQGQVTAQRRLCLRVRFEALKFLPVRILRGRHQFARLQTNATAGFQPFKNPLRLPFPGADNFRQLFQ